MDQKLTRYASTVREGFMHRWIEVDHHVSLGGDLGVALLDKIVHPGAEALALYGIHEFHEVALAQACCILLWR